MHCKLLFFPVQEGKNLFPAFEKIKSIFDNNQRGPESSAASSQQALLLDSPFNRKEATISNKAAKMHPYSNPSAPRALLAAGLKCHGGTIGRDKLPFPPKKDVRLIFNYS